MLGLVCGSAPVWFHQIACDLCVDTQYEMTLVLAEYVPDQHSASWEQGMTEQKEVSTLSGIVDKFFCC